MTSRGRKLCRRLLWVLAALALLALTACGKEEASAGVIEGILVYQHGETFYLYTEGAGDGIYTVPGKASLDELAVGQRVRVNYDGGVLEIAPPQFSEIVSIDILGTAQDEEFQTGLDYFNTQVKPWHISSGVQ